MFFPALLPPADFPVTSVTRFPSPCFLPGKPSCRVCGFPALIFALKCGGVLVLCLFILCFLTPKKKKKPLPPVHQEAPALPGLLIGLTPPQQPLRPTLEPCCLLCKQPASSSPSTLQWACVWWWVGGLDPSFFLLCPAQSQMALVVKQVLPDRFFSPCPWSSIHLFVHSVSNHPLHSPLDLTTLRAACPGRIYSSPRLYPLPLPTQQYLQFAKSTDPRS